MDPHSLTRSLSAFAVASLFYSTIAEPIPHSRFLDRSTAANPSLGISIPAIKFSPCAANLGLPSTLQCGTLSVPVDWANPTGPQVELGISKLPAQSSTTTKVGSLLVNPGGPGAPSTQLVTFIAQNVAQFADIANAFDIIGLDPRGTGLSSPIKCDASIYAEPVSLFPKTQADYDALVDKNKRWGESCLNQTGPLIQHLDTLSVAKDHEAVRIALGNEPLNFLGLSYGSLIGAQYAQLFPSQIRTLALDGIVDHSGTEDATLLVASQSYSVSFSDFLSWASTDKTSVLAGKNATAFFETLIANATKAPLPAPSCDGTVCSKTVSAEDILFNAQADLILTSTWPVLASALLNASTGDASALSTQFNDPTAQAGIAISCLDWTHDDSSTLAGLTSEKATLDAAAPLTGAASQFWQIENACLGWPVPVVNPQKVPDINTNATILLAASTKDPETGYAWAQTFQKQVPNTVLVTRQGDGHTSSLLGGQTAETIFKYLVTGTPPAKGLTLTT